MHAYLRLSMFAVFLCLAGCKERLREVSTHPTYAHMIGRRYLVSDEVEIYAIFGFESPAKVVFVTLLPPPGIDGPEIAQVLPVAAGSIVTIRQVCESNRWDFDDITYVVDLQGTEVPWKVPIRIETGLGNTAFNELELNPKYYTRVN